MRLSIVVLMTVASTIAFSGCTSKSKQNEFFARGIASYDVPTAEQLFLVGKFSQKGKSLLSEKHFGEEMDLSERRPVVNLTGTLFHAKYGDTESTLIANLYHDGKFWIARVPRKTVKGVYFILAYFPPKIMKQYIAAHSLLRFELDENHPVELVAEMPHLAALEKLRGLTPYEAFNSLAAPLTGKEHQLTNIAISAEAQWSKSDKGKAYDLKRGLLDAYIQVVRVVSMEERFRGFYGNGRPANEIKLETTKPLDPILTTGMTLSQTDGLSKLYNTLQYNCTTLAFDIVEQGLQQKDPRIGEIRKYMQKRVPIFSPAKLEAYGGMEVLPMQMDPTLAAESLAAYKKVVVEKGRKLCPPSFVDETCPNVRSALDTIKTVYPTQVFSDN